MFLSFPVFSCLLAISRIFRIFTLISFFKDDHISTFIHLSQRLDHERPNIDALHLSPITSQIWCPATDATDAQQPTPSNLRPASLSILRHKRHAKLGIDANWRSDPSRYCSLTHLTTKNKIKGKERKKKTKVDNSARKDNFPTYKEERRSGGKNEERWRETFSQVFFLYVRL